MVLCVSFDFFLCFFRFIDSIRVRALAFRSSKLKQSRKQPDSSASGCLREASPIEKPLHASSKQRLKSRARVERTSCSIGASIPCTTFFKIIQSSCSSSR
ncbi:hypothetical protein AMTRI_Chr02g259200 [Amborella trichopoda]